MNIFIVNLTYANGKTIEFPFNSLANAIQFMRSYRNHSQFGRTSTFRLEVRR